MSSPSAPAERGCREPGFVTGPLHIERFTSSSTSGAQANPNTLDWVRHSNAAGFLGRSDGLTGPDHSTSIVEGYAGDHRHLPNIRFRIGEISGT